MGSSPSNWARDGELPPSLSTDGIQVRNDSSTENRHHDDRSSLQGSIRTGRAGTLPASFYDLHGRLLGTATHSDRPQYSGVVIPRDEKGRILQKRAEIEW
jgi:hypothetical protein